MHLTIAYSKIKKRNLVLINNVTHQIETLTEWPIRLPLKSFFRVGKTVFGYVLFLFKKIKAEIKITN